MSLAHLRVLRTKDSDSAVEYVVESPDFNEQGTDEAIGQLLIDKEARTYTFNPFEVLAGEKFLPPWVYGLEENERKALLETKFKGYGYGAWSGVIHHWATQFMKENSFPEKHPVSNFP